MRTALAVSVTVHAALIAWGLFALAARPFDTANDEAIPVSFLTIAETTSLPKAAPPPVAKPVPPTPTPPPVTSPIAKAEPESVPVPRPAPAPVAPAVAPASVSPAPAPIAPAVVKAAITAPSASIAPPKPRVAPQPPTAPPPTLKADPKPAPAPLDAGGLAAVLDRQEPAPAPTQPKAEPDSAALGALIASAEPHMTASEVDALRARIAACWTPPPGWVDPAEVRVVLIVSLNADGSVGAVPQVVDAPAGVYRQTAPESAIRAVQLCAPYALPPEKYEDWKEVKITFDPRAMG